MLGTGEWLIGRDTRECGPAFEAALVDGLTAGGGDRALAGVVPTPRWRWLASSHGVPAAMITASHNPCGDNGVKLFAAGGLKLDDDAEAAIEARLDALLHR